MDNEYWIAIIGIAGTTVGVFLGFFLQIFYSIFQERKNIRYEFEYAKNRVLSLNLLNEYLVVMHELREFFIKYRRFLYQKEISEFYNKWLTNPDLYYPKSISNVIDVVELVKLKKELTKIDLDFKYLNNRVIKKLIKKKQIKESKQKIRFSGSYYNK